MNYEWSLETPNYICLLVNSIFCHQVFKNFTWKTSFMICIVADRDTGSLWYVMWLDHGANQWQSWNLNQNIWMQALRPASPSCGFSPCLPPPLLIKGSPDYRGAKISSLEKDERYFLKKTTHINRHTAFISHSGVEKIATSRCTDQTQICYLFILLSV